jgi:hypothetical protein
MDVTSKDYHSTHQEFKMYPHDSETIRNTLRNAFGDTDHLTSLASRTWFTLDPYFYVSREYANSSLITWMLLHQ